MDDYTLMTVAKGASVHSCNRCGAVVIQRAIHDAWHSVNDHFEQATTDMLLQLASQE